LLVKKGTNNMRITLGIIFIFFLAFAVTIVFGLILAGLASFVLQAFFGMLLM